MNAECLAERGFEGSMRQRAVKVRYLRVNLAEIS